ncbi:hypothetical protein MAM1_0057c03649 [Mucor ambiguus]|uniref:Uncharacterized protein n=1 Tax=Mucor ambiguus TaxID=91626 RepID=A0A0C9MA00_9FUNG|nr:hypothetical protein MAM1_0057c03649 [Mucor ambiguus]
MSREKKSDESDDTAPYASDDLKAEVSPSLNDLFSNEKPKATKRYISRFPFVTWTLVSIIGIVFCLIHSHQDSLWQWTGDTASDAQSLQAKVVISIFSAIIGGCLVALLSKALVSVSFVLLRYRGASLSHLATVIEGYTPSRIPILAVEGGWASSIIIIFIMAVSVTTKQTAVVSMGVDFMSTNSTKLSYTKNYTSCGTPLGASTANTMATTVSTQIFSALLNPNDSFTNEYYDSSIPLGLVGLSRFERVLPYAETSCVQFNSSKGLWLSGAPPVTGSGYTWQTKVTLPFTNMAEDFWINCTIRSGWAKAISTCHNTKCETARTSENITSYENGGNGLSLFFEFLFGNYMPSSSSSNNLVVTWLLGGDVLRKLYTRGDILPTTPTVESISNRLALLGTVLTRVVCDVNLADEEYAIPDSPITSNYIDHSYYHYRLLWAWPFYLLAGCIFFLWALCMMAMWIAPESRVLSTDWLLRQYILRYQDGYLAEQQPLQAHCGAKYQVFDDNANDDSGNIVISRTESRKSDRYDRVSQHKQY